jgi:phage anti-repressor protein
MTVTTNKQSAVKDSRLQEAELPLIQQGDNLLIDARLLHQQLKVGRDFSTWIKVKIEEFGFEPNKDFFSGISPNRGKTTGRPSVDVHLTLDMAKELAMVERNEIGRSIRRYFIQKEKEARGTGHLPKEAGLFKGMKPKRFNDRTMYPYREVLVRCGYKASSNGGRTQRYWMHFVKEGKLLYTTEEFALHLFKQKQVYLNRAAMLATQPVLPLNFGDVSQLKSA